MEEKDQAKYFPMYYSYREQLKLLTFEQIGMLVLALLEYGRSGSEPDFPQDSNLYMAYSFMREESRRAESRRREIIEKRREAGKARAASAMKDEHGRFISSNVENSEDFSDENQQKSSKSSKSRYSNSKVKVNSKSNSKSNRQDARVCAQDDSDEVQSEILAYCREAVGTLSQTQEQKVLTAAQGLSFDAVMDAITIAIDNDAKTPEYIVKSILTQKEKPDRRPEYGR